MCSTPNTSDGWVGVSTPSGTLALITQKIFFFFINKIPIYKSFQQQVLKLFVQDTINIPVCGRNLEKNSSTHHYCYIKFSKFKFQCSIPIGRCRYLSSYSKSTIDLCFLLLFINMHMKTRNFSYFKYLKNNHD